MTSSATQPPAEPRPARRLGADEVHIWWMPVETETRWADALISLLSSGEERRRSSFHDAEEGRRWAVARGGLRAVLAAYTGRPPVSLRFCRGTYGKLELEGHQLSFSLTHSGDVAVYALARDRRVGVDAERVVPQRASLLVADTFLSAEASTRLRSQPAERFPREFFRLWTRHEALVKAIGTGLPDGEPDAAAVDWWVRELPFGPEYAAALAIEGGPCRVLLLGLRPQPGSHTPHGQREPSEPRAVNDGSRAVRLQGKGEATVPASDLLTL